MGWEGAVAAATAWVAEVGWEAGRAGVVDVGAAQPLMAWEAAKRT